MSSVYLHNSRTMVPKLLFTVCGSDGAPLDRDDPNAAASVMSAKLGYGNCAGFFASNSIAFSPESTTAAEVGPNGREVDPITGAYRNRVSTELPPMTDAEMEREAEKMFTLFDRMNRNGAINVENPMRAAQQSGRFEELGAQDAAAQLDEDDEEERQALAELAQYKARQKRALA